MIKEYYKFIKDYLKLAEIKPKYFIINLVTAFLYRAFLLLMPLFASLIIKGLTDGNALATYASLAGLVVSYILYNVAIYVNYIIYGFNANQCFSTLQSKVLRKLIKIDPNFTKNFSKGRLMNSVNGDILDIGDMNDEICEMIVGVLQIMVLFVIIGFINVWLVIILLVFALLYVTLRNRADRKVNLWHEKTVSTTDMYGTLLTQVVAGLQEVKTFDMLPKLDNLRKSIQRKYSKYYSAKRYWYDVRDNGVKVLKYVFMAILYVVLIVMVMNGQIRLDTLVLVVLYQENLTDALEWLIETTMWVREVSISVKRINAILDYKPGEVIKFGDITNDETMGNLSFKDVAFTVGDHQILKNISFKVNQGEVVAIVGEAGSGKTTIFNLLLRLMKPTQGSIKIDGIDVFDFQKKVYPNVVSVVNQKPFIFNMSIRQNLDFADTNHERQIEACKRAGIHNFIMTLPKGYDTVLRENAKNISGGQKQMISIARTILMDAEILLLDDITTSLDPDTAKLVPRLIDNLKKDHTIMMITKKPDLMECADRIIVLDHGKIAASGSHGQLIKTNQLYQALFMVKSASRNEVFDHI